MKKTKIFVYSALGLALAISLYFIFFNGKKQEAVQEVGLNKLSGQFEGAIAQPTTFSQEIEVSGTIQPFDETPLTSEISGKVVSLNIQEGKSVRKGSVLVKLFDEDLQAQLKMLEVQLKIAKNNESRMKTLLNVQGTSQQEYDASLLQVSNLNAQIDILKVNIGKTEIRAPYDGVLGLKKISLGQYLTPATPIATIRAINSMKLDFSVPEGYSGAMKSGLKINFSVAGSDNTYNATVMASEYSVESDSRNMNVRALIAGNVNGLTPGAFAKVKVDLGTRDNAILLPTSAIIPQASEKKVYVIRNGMAQLTTVQTGVRQVSSIEVISGLNVGDTVVTTGLMFIKPNIPIKFAKIN